MPSNNPSTSSVNRPATRKSVVADSSVPPASPVSSGNKTEKTEKLKSVKEFFDKPDKPKEDMASELAKFKLDLEEMLKDSEGRMSKLIKEGEDRVSKQLKDIETKFTVKIDELRGEMKSEIKSVKADVSNTKSEVKHVKEKVLDLEKSVQYHSDKLEDSEKSQEEKLKSASAELDEKIKLLDTKLQLLEKQDRKYNLLFYGFQEDAEEDVYEIIRQSLIEDLKLEEDKVRNMYFAAGHRVPTKAAGPKPIIIRCTSLEDRELILSNSKYYGAKKKRVVVDLPKEMKEERSRLVKKAYEIRQKEDKQTRIRDKGLNVFLEVRNDQTDKWVKRVV